MTTSSTQKLVRLAEGMLRRTKDGSIRWQVVDAENAFRFESTNGYVDIETQDGDGGAPYRLSVLNADRVEIDALIEDPTTISPWDETLRELFRAAKRNALNIDVVLDGIFRDLGIEEQ